MDCYADDREALNDFEKYFNNAHLSDVVLIVGDDCFYAHRIILVKSSEVFEKMLSGQWDDGKKKEIMLVEDQTCMPIFPIFLRFLYTNHVVLNNENTLPIMTLADKYNVQSLRKVCLEYAVNEIIPHLSTKDIFNVWFQYGTKSYHKALISTCIRALATVFEEIISSTEWENEWLNLDKDQLCEFLKSNELTISGEYQLWTAVVRWIMAPSHPERRTEKLLQQILPLIRFPLMRPDELNSVEQSALPEQHAKVFQQHLLNAYKFQALPLSSRVTCHDFSGGQLLLRNYADIRWDKRIAIPNMSNIARNQELTFKIQTRASCVPEQSWDWELKVHPKGYPNYPDDFRVSLTTSVLLDQTRSVEYLLSFVDQKKIIKSVTGRKTFSKSRYVADLETEKKVSVEELTNDHSQFLVNDTLHLQLTLKPVD